jgi:histidyl-tRNA synthetase
VLIVGDAELASGKANLRDMATKQQAEVVLAGLADTLKQTLTVSP